MIAAIGSTKHIFEGAWDQFRPHKSSVLKKGVPDVGKIPDPPSTLLETA
jgi:hypothetical protein